MQDPNINADKLRELCDEVNKLELTKAQKAQLDAILKQAWIIVAPEEALEGKFDASFEPGQAQLISAYHDASAGIFSIQGSIRGSIKAPPHP